MGTPPTKRAGTPPGGGLVTALISMRTPSGQDILICGNRNHTITMWDPVNLTMIHRLEFGEPVKDCRASGTSLLVGSKSGVTAFELGQW
jgi:hypothetical protein